MEKYQNYQNWSDVVFISLFFLTSSRGSKRFPFDFYYLAYVCLVFLLLLFCWFLLQSCLLLSAPE